jgi:hypothetical protein
MTGSDRVRTPWIVSRRRVSFDERTEGVKRPWKAILVPE